MFYLYCLQKSVQYTLSWSLCFALNKQNIIPVLPPPPQAVEKNKPELL